MQLHAENSIHYYGNFAHVGLATERVRLATSLISLTEYKVE